MNKRVKDFIILFLLIILLVALIALVVYVQSNRPDNSPEGYWTKTVEYPIHIGWKEWNDVIDRLDALEELHKDNF